MNPTATIKPKSNASNNNSKPPNPNSWSSPMTKVPPFLNTDKIAAKIDELNNLGYEHIHKQMFYEAMAYL